MGTAIVVIALVVVALLAVRSICKDKKSGRSSCGGDCRKCKGCH